MQTRRLLTLLLVVALGLGACASAPPLSPTPLARPAETPGALTLSRIYSEPPLEGRAPIALGLSPGGTYATWLQPNAADSEILDLWALQLPAGTPAPLVATADLLGGASQKLTEAERMALERKRITKRGITDYTFCGKDDRALLFPLSGDLWLVRLGAPGAAPDVTRLTNDDDVPERNPTCSPDGARVAFVRGADVVSLDLSTRRATRVTPGGSDTRTFGLAEFVAEEEMGRHEGFWWSPDGKRLLVLEVDESPVGIKRRAQIHAERTDIVDQRYPAAGEPNAQVSAWVFDAASKSRPVRLGLPEQDGYVARAGFFPDGAPWVQWQSRDQRLLVLYEADARGALREVLREEDAAWIELHDDLRTLDDGATFVWSSEHSGRRQLERVDRASGARTPLTDLAEPVHGVLGVDREAGQVLFSAYTDRGRQLQVFTVPLAGGAPRQVTAEPGTHMASADASGRYFVDRYSDYLTPVQTTLRRASGEIVHVVDPNPAEALKAFPRPEATWMDVTASDGSILNALLLTPPGVTPGSALRYPVIVYVYGGPGAQTVRRAWQRMWLPLMAWTHMGYGVFLVDNRGMAGRNRAFTRGHHDRFGVVEREDLDAGLAALKAVPWVDPERIGIFGWSYGGYLAARAVLEAGSPFAAAAAVAPVTDWTLYDTHYTERFIGMPGTPEAPAATYAASNLVTRASLLERPLLLVHGTADDNVLLDHTLKLAEALQNHSKLFEMMLYPGKAHGISGRAAQLHVFSTVTAFFDRHLGRHPRPGLPVVPPSP